MLLTITQGYDHIRFNVKDRDEATNIISSIIPYIGKVETSFGLMEETEEPEEEE